MFTSKRASGPPKQAWMPLPQPRCWLSRRSGSNWFGLGNRFGSRFAAPYMRRTAEPFGMTVPPISMSASSGPAGKELDRRLEAQDFLDGAGDQTPAGGAAARGIPGFRSMVSTQWEIGLTVES